MPRRGLDAARVVAAAAAVADAEGLEAVTVARLAADLGVRAPSLYNHVAGREGLVRGVALLGAAGMAETLRGAAVGRAGADALRAAARAYRGYAQAHPGRYAAAQRAPAAGDAALTRAAEEAVGTLLAILRGYGLEGDAAVHAVRSVRSALHGFVALEAAGGFGLPLDLDASFDALVALLAAGLSGGPE